MRKVFPNLVQTLLLCSGFALADSEGLPDLDSKNLAGKAECLADYRGKIVVLNFWDSHSLPCRDQMPVLVEVQDRYGSRGVQVIGASIDEASAKKEVKKFAKELGLNFPVWLGVSVTDQLRFGMGHTIPATVLLDRSGEIAFKIIGESSSQVLSERIEWLLSDRSAEKPDSLVLPALMSRGSFGELLAQEEEHHHEEVHSHEHEAGSAVPS